MLEKCCNNFGSQQSASRVAVTIVTSYRRKAEIIYRESPSVPAFSDLHRFTRLGSWKQVRLVKQMTTFGAQPAFFVLGETRSIEGKS